MLTAYDPAEHCPMNLAFPDVTHPGVIAYMRLMPAASPNRVAANTLITDAADHDANGDVALEVNCVLRPPVLVTSWGAIPSCLN